MVEKEIKQPILHNIICVPQSFNYEMHSLSCPLCSFLYSAVFVSISLQRQLDHHHIRAAMMASYLTMMVEKKR